MFTTFTDENGNTYEVWVFDKDSCSVRLLPQETLLFRSGLEWLEYSSMLEDGDATHEVPAKTVEEIGAWARKHGYED